MTHSSPAPLPLFLLPPVLLSGCLAPAPAPRGPATDPASIVLADETGAEAIVAPAFGGRVLAFRPAGAADGENLFWTNPLDDIVISGWPNHGGEKTWIGPQEFWSEMTGTGWPPPAFFDCGRYHVWPGATSNAVTLLSPSPGDTVCPFIVERAISLANGALRVESRLRPLPKSGDAPSRALDEYIAWSVAQVPHSPRVAVRTLPPARVQDGSKTGPNFPTPAVQDGGILVFDLTGIDFNAKAFFDADAIAIELEGGSLVARRIPGPDDPAPNAVPFPEHARAELYSGSVGGHPDVRYIELEFTSTGIRPLIVEYSFLPDTPCDKALLHP